MVKAVKLFFDRVLIFNKRASMRIMKLLMSYCLDMKAKLLKSSALFA